MTTHATLSHPAFCGLDRARLGDLIEELASPWTARRESALHDRPGLRPRTLADVLAHAKAEDVEVRTDGTETGVRRTKAHRPGRRAFVSGGKKQNTIKTTTTAMPEAAPCSAAQTGRAACMTRPRCAPRASLSRYACTRE